MVYKKILLVFLIIIFGALLNAEDMIVTVVSGKVTKEVNQGKWVDVKVGDILLLTTMVNTGLNSKLVFTQGKTIFTIPAMTKKTIAMFLGSLTSTKGTLVIPSIQNTSISANSVQNSTNIPTASTRASDASADVSWDE